MKILAFLLSMDNNVISLRRIMEKHRTVVNGENITHWNCGVLRNLCSGFPIGIEIVGKVATFPSSMGKLLLGLRSSEHLTVGDISLLWD